jgi:gluconokinase
MAMAIILMGVAGSGKSTVGRRLGEVLDWPFYDGDDYMPTEKVARMAAGIPLEDADRAPWLDILHELMAAELGRGVSLILACSSLKEKYRARLRAGLEDGVRFVYLKGDFDLIYARLQARPGHFMLPAMLRSQFDTLEEPEGAVAVDIGQDLEALVFEILQVLGLGTAANSA